MQQTPWSLSKIKQCKEKTGQPMFTDEHSLALFSEDFGKLTSEKPYAVITPLTLPKLQALLHFTHINSLPLTIRGKGLSQSGQSLPVMNGVTLSMENFNKVDVAGDNEIWVEANATWSELLSVSLKQNKIPYVVPNNCHLSIGGVISAGGIGASSFKFGSVVNHVKALEVATATGKVETIDSSSPLFHACLGGQGQYGVITKACISLRSCPKKIRTFFLLYLEKEPWLDDLHYLIKEADYLDVFCSPAVQGAKLLGSNRLPFAEWFFAIHMSYEYENKAPEWLVLSKKLHYWKMLHHQDEAIRSYLHRHDGRFNAMKMSGQWNAAHPWYECFVPENVFVSSLENLLHSVPLYYANMLQVMPVADIQSNGFFMLPHAESIIALMILNPGLPQALVPGSLKAIDSLDKVLLSQGGKRYLSGFIGKELSENYWKNHFADQYENWKRAKEVYDPKHTFCSLLYPRFLT